MPNKTIRDQGSVMSDAQYMKALALVLRHPRNVRVWDRGHVGTLDTFSSEQALRLVAECIEQRRVPDVEIL